MANVISFPSQAKPARAKALRTTIDLDAPDARKKLIAIHPHVVRDELLTATAEAAEWVTRYEAAREIERDAVTDKEHAAGYICAAIGGAAGIVAGDVKATWLDSSGTVDWQALADELQISDATIERFRRPGSRVLRVAPLPLNERARR